VPHPTLTASAYDDGRRATAKNTGGELAPSTATRSSAWLVTIVDAALDEGLI